MLWILLLLVQMIPLRAQLQIEIRQYEESLDLSNFTVLADYTFPSGFTTDWLITTHSNIPSDGISGILYHPYPPNGCSSLNMSKCPTCDSELSKIAILDDYQLCTQQKIYSIRESSFDALITYNLEGGVPDLRDKVYDESIRENVRIETDGIPFLVVTKEFADVLLREAVIGNCSMGDVRVYISIGPMTSVSFILTVTVLIIGFLMFCCLLLVVLSRIRKCRRRGQYNVHEIHMELEEFSEPRVQYLGTQTLPYTPKQHEYNCAEDGDTQCAICLEDFGEGEVVSVLGCDGNHMFHPACIDRWLESQSMCPVCRTFMNPIYVT